MPAPVLAQSGVPVTSLSAVTSGVGTPVVIPPNCKMIDVILRGSGTISGGTLRIEEASDPTYTGDWSIIQVDDADTIPADDLTSDAEMIIHMFALIRNIRVSVVDAITGGGNVTAEIVCS